MDASCEVRFLGTTHILDKILFMTDGGLQPRSYKYAPDDSVENTLCVCFLQDRSFCSWGHGVVFIECCCTLHIFSKTVE